jgi:hypothetical protein
MKREKFSVHPGLDSILLTRSLFAIEKLLMKYFGVFCSHSWAGEDAILRQLIDDPRNWTYLDIGSGHPSYLSNTYWMYSNGAKGVLIDCNKVLIEFSKQIRPRDICINAAIGAGSKTMTFYEYSSWSLTTSNLEWVKTYKEQGMIPIKSYSLPSINFYELYAEIDSKKNVVISLDIEGASDFVIKSFIKDFKKGRILVLPKVWLIEVEKWPLSNDDESKSILELMKLGYQVHYNHTRTLILTAN